MSNQTRPLPEGTALITTLRIGRGAYDADLRAMRDAIDSRLTKLAAAPATPATPATPALRVGDKVVLCGGLRPKYLHGVEVVVTKLNQQTVGATFPASAPGKWAGATKVRVPRSCVRPA